MNTLPVLFQDDHLVAVNKPSGLLVHRTEMDRREPENAMTALRDQLGKWVYPVHRLDKGTSGVLLFALDKETARGMMELFTAEKVRKSYVAVVRGYTAEAERIDHALRERERMLAAGARRDRPARQAITEYRRLATVELPLAVGRYRTARFSLVLVNPLTGRSHQVRRHMKHVFHPVIGDTTYGDGKQNELFRSNFDCRRLLLHALRIEFPHPRMDRYVRISAPVNGVLAVLLGQLPWEGDVRAALTTDGAVGPKQE